MNRYSADLRNVIRVGVIGMLAIAYYGYVFPHVLAFWIRVIAPLILPGMPVTVVVN